MPQVHHRSIYAIHIKEGVKKTAVGLATFRLDDIIAFMWGKDSAMYFLVIDDIEYDLETTEPIDVKIRAIVDFHDAFYRC